MSPCTGVKSTECAATPASLMPPLIPGGLSDSLSWPTAEVTPCFEDTETPAQPRETTTYIDSYTVSPPLRYYSTACNTKNSRASKHQQNAVPLRKFSRCFCSWGKTPKTPSCSSYLFAGLALYNNLIYPTYFAWSELTPEHKLLRPSQPVSSCL